MSTIKHHKVVVALPDPLEADSVYYVRKGGGFDQYVTNSAGVIIAYPQNVGAGVTVATPDGLLRAKTVAAMSVVYTGGRVTRVTEDGEHTDIAYNSEGTVATVTMPLSNGAVRTETYAYANGLVTGMTASEV